MVCDGPAISFEYEAWRKRKSNSAAAANHVGVREATRLDDFQEVAGVIDVPTGDAADTLEAVHDISVDAKRVARLGYRRVVRLQKQEWYDINKPNHAAIRTDDKLTN